MVLSYYLAQIYSRELEAFEPGYASESFTAYSDASDRGRVRDDPVPD
jgi:hypothetical protein